MLGRLSGSPRLMACLLYGAGLRVLECCQLRIQDVDFATSQILVRSGTGEKDRLTMLPGVIKGNLERHLGRRCETFERADIWSEIRNWTRTVLGR